MKKTVRSILLLILILIPNKSLANEENTLYEYPDVIQYNATNIDSILYPNAVNDMDKPQIFDGFMKDQKTVEKYATKFAYRYAALEDSNDSSIYVEDLVDEMLDDPNVVVSRELAEYNYLYKQYIIQNLHRYIEIYRDDVEYEMCNKHIHYDNNTGKYYIPQDDELRESTKEVYTNSNSDIEYIVYRAPNKSQENETRQKADEIVRNVVKDNMTDREKIEALTNYLIKNTIYDVGGKKGSVIENNEYGALIKHATECDGIARAYTMLLRKANIPAITVYGWVGDTNHAWNVVKLDNRWQIVDVTGSLTRYKKNLKNNKIDEKYFLKTYDDLKDHETVKGSLYYSIMNLTK